MPTMQFTAHGIRALRAPEQGRVEYHDELLPGLVLRVGTSGKKSYSVQYRKAGKRSRVTIGDASLLSLAEARARAKAVLRDVKLDIIDPAAQRRQERDAETLAELATRYIERWAKPRKAPRSAREDELKVERVLIPRWGDWKASDIRKRDVVALLDEYVDAKKLAHT